MLIKRKKETRCTTQQVQKIWTHGKDRLKGERGLGTPNRKCSLSRAVPEGRARVYVTSPKSQPLLIFLVLSESAILAALCSLPRALMTGNHI